jgi:hypothetical protein
MIRRLSGPLSILLLATIPSAHAQTGGPVDLFQGLDSIRVSVTFGGPLDQQGGTVRRLLADDLKRFNLFDLKLTEAITTKLETCGLFVDSSVANELSVEVFGRLEKLQQCTPRYVYLVQAKLRNSKLKGNQTGEPIFFRPVIGIADDAGMERAVIDDVIASISDELRRCRKPSPKPAQVNGN